MAEDLKYDGSQVFTGGQDASKSPTLVPQDSYFAGVNVSVSRGVFQPRWGFRKLKPKIPSGGVTISPQNSLVPYEEIFFSGRFQCFIPVTIGGDYYLLIVVSGIIFLVNQDTLDTTIIPIQGGGSLNENTPRLNWAHANKFTVIFDFPNFPVIFDGITARRSNPALFEVPVSVGGAYNQNRLFIYNAGNSYTAGDPTGNLATPNAPITFEEVEAPAAAFLGQVFDLPTDRIEPITAMGFLQQTDTSTGIGPLLIGTMNAIYSVQSQLPRTQWEASTFASAFVLNAGIAGFRSWCNVNSDVFFLSNDGQVRTAAMSRQEQGKWARVPISREVQNWLKYWDRDLVSYGVLGYFNNKIFITANPYRTNAFDTQRNPIFDVANAGMVVLSLDNIATLGKDSTPAWDGLWTGVNPMDIAVNNQRCFVISKDAEFANEIYEMDPKLTYDVDNQDIRYVVSTVYTREYDFQSPLQLKDAHSLNVGLRDVQGDFSCNVYFKPPQGEYYALWQKFSRCAPWRDCGMPTDFELNGLAPLNFREITFGSPVQGDACDTTSSFNYATFRRVQLKFIIEGKYWELQEFRLVGKLRPESQQITESCVDTLCVKAPANCTPTDWAVGAFRSCLQSQT